MVADDATHLVMSLIYKIQIICRREKRTTKTVFAIVFLLRWCVMLN